MKETPISVRLEQLLNSLPDPDDEHIQTLQEAINYIKEMEQELSDYEQRAWERSSRK